MTAGVLQVGSGFHDEKFGDLVVTNVVDETPSPVGTVVFVLKDRDGGRYHLIAGICFPVGAA